MSKCYTQVALTDRLRLHYLVTAEVLVNDMARHRSRIYRSFTVRKMMA